MRKYFAAAVAAAALALVAGCAGDSDPGTAAQSPAASPPGTTAVEAVENPMETGCVWQAFEATVRTGPNAGSELRGQLVAAALDGQVGGHLFPEGDPEAGVPVSGSLDGGDLRLAFTTGAGVFDGTGVVEGGMCQEGLEGPLTGPAAGDEGDWIGLELDEYEVSAVPLSSLEPVEGFEDQNNTSNTFTQLSPSCTQTVYPDATVIRCTNGDVICSTSYPAGGGTPQTSCHNPKKPLSRPGIN